MDNNEKIGKLIFLFYNLSSLKHYSMDSFDLKGWQILIVDDDADSITMFAELLKHEKGLVDKTQSSVHALQLLKTRTYDLLISDVNMPEMDG